VVGDLTVEALVAVHERNPRGLLKVDDEGSRWPHEMNQYKGGRGTDRQFYLSAWSGKGYVMDRKALGGVPVSIPRPFVNVVCGIQPDLLGELADPRGRSDGFIDRLLFCFPRPAAGSDWTDNTVSEDAAKAWAGALEVLRGLDMVAGQIGTPGPRTVRLSPAAKEVWVRWWNDHAAELRDPELPARLVGPFAKLTSYAARLALILHHLWEAGEAKSERVNRPVKSDGDAGEIGPEMVGRAVELVKYFQDHARRVYARLRQAPADDRLDDALDWVRSHGGECTARDLLRYKKAANAGAARTLLRELEERGHGRCETRDADNNKKVVWFVFDPQ
jgi:hypothetical protein